MEAGVPSELLMQELTCRLPMRPACRQYLQRTCPKV